MKKLPGTIIAVAALAIMGVALAKEPGAALKNLGPAPEFSLQTLDGKTLSLASLKGKVVVVDFWATWCPPCVAEMPGFQELQTKYADKGVVFVGVSLDRRGAAQVKEFLQKNRITYAVGIGDSGHVEAFGGFDAIPTTFLIDRAGDIRHRKTGGMERDDFEKLLKPLL
jgi:thiol-disulfide isomerase/thioredoxin